MNRIEISGNLGKEPEVRQLQNGVAVNFTINDGDGYKDKQSGQWVDKSSWFNVSWFPDQNDTSYQQLHKGMKINIIGKMRQRSYQGQDGQNHSVWEVTPDRNGISIILLTPKAQQPQGYAPAPQYAPQPQYAPPASPYQQAPPAPQYAQQPPQPYQQPYQPAPAPAPTPAPPYQPAPPTDFLEGDDLPAGLQ